MQLVEPLLQLHHVLLVHQALDQLGATQIVLALPLREALDQALARDQALDRLQAFLGRGARNRFVALVHGTSAAGMRARIISVLRCSHAVLRWRS